MRLLSHSLIVALGLAFTSMASHAETDSVNLNVKVTIAATCDIQSIAPSDVDFGEILSSAVNTDAAGTLRVNCTPGTDYSIGLDEGQNFDGTTRRMAKGTDHVEYELYRDAARAQRWGDDAASSFAGTGSGAAQSISVYGRIGSANAPSGDYSDVIVATVTY